ncbi:25560_t:CDS:1, partial [Gigaspora rosea]
IMDVVYELENVMAVDYLFWRFLEWLFSTDEIDIAPAFPYQKYRK